MATFDLDGVTLVKDGRTILDAVTLHAADGEMLALVGASGSGKTSVLRVAAGLEKVGSGQIRLGGTDVRDLEPAARNVAMVFQTSVLYPFRDVEANVAFPLHLQRRPGDEVARRVHAEGRALHITALLGRDPSELSAGQQQLVQVARAMVRVPDLFLLDEPLAMLDPVQRHRLRAELRTVQAGYGVTALYATNDPAEAMAIADRVAVLDGGGVSQVGEPMAVYRRAATRLVAELMGELSVVPVVVDGDGHGWWLRRHGLEVRAWTPELGGRAGQTVDLGLRPEDVTATDRGPWDVVHVEVRGSHDAVDVAAAGAEIRVFTRPGVLHRGDTVALQVRAGIVLDPAGGTIGFVEG